MDEARLREAAEEIRADCGFGCDHLDAEPILRALLRETVAEALAAECPHCSRPGHFEPSVRVAKGNWFHPFKGLKIEDDRGSHCYAPAIRERFAWLSK